MSLTLLQCQNSVIRWLVAFTIQLKTKPRSLHPEKTFDSDPAFSRGSISSEATEDISNIASSDSGIDSSLRQLGNLYQAAEIVRSVLYATPDNVLTVYEILRQVWTWIIYQIYGKGDLTFQLKLLSVWDFKFLKISYKCLFNKVNYLLKLRWTVTLATDSGSYYHYYDSWIVYKYFFQVNPTAGASPDSPFKILAHLILISLVSLYSLTKACSFILKSSVIQMLVRLHQFSLSWLGFSELLTYFLYFPRWSLLGDRTHLCPSWHWFFHFS